MYPIKHVRSLDFLDGTSESPQEHCHKSRRTLMSPQECEIAWCTPKSTGDEALFAFIVSRAILDSRSYTTSGLTSFQQFQRFPETSVSCVEEHQFQKSNLRKALSTTNCLEMRADPLALTEEICQLFTSTSRGVFPQQ